MTQTFKLKKGEILFDDDKIIIKDDAKKQRNLTLLSSSMWTIYGTTSVLRYFKTGDQFLLWTGLFIGIAHFVIFILNLRRTVKSEIPFDGIKSLKVKQRFSNEFLDIKLKNSRLRRVILADNETELEEYIETNFRTT
jgi:hypothetical protein